VIPYERRFPPTQCICIDASLNRACCESAQLQAEVEAAEARLAAEQAGFSEERRLFAHTAGVAGLMKTCHKEQQRKREADTVLNNKKLDLLKVRVSYTVPCTVYR
jgi:hypothetical protein